DLRIRKALQATLTSSYIRRAARHGIFVSYHRNDELFTLELSTALQEAGLKVWMDAISVPEDSDWRNEVIGAMRDCGIMIVVLSQKSMTDAELEEERRYFLSTGKILIPVLRENCDFRKLRLMIDPVDFRYDMNIGIRRLLYLMR
ncbi:MAG: toll/interleukin-1 receptor domain-containing protein, partial [Aggregatilineales bacterium]